MSQSQPFTPTWVVVLEGRVPDGGQPELEKFIAEARTFYEEPGGIRVRLLWDHVDATRFREVIEYETDRDYRADADRVQNNSTMKGLLDRWRSVIEGEPTVSTWREVTPGMTD